MQETVQQSKKTKSRYSIFAPPRIRPFYAKGLRIDLERLLMSSFVEKSTVEFVKALKLPIHPIIADYDYSSLVDALKVDHRILYGPLLADVFTSLHPNEAYSILEFLLDLWCLGFIFFPNSRETIALKERFGSNFSNSNSELLINVDLLLIDSNNVEHRFRVEVDLLDYLTNIFAETRETKALPQEPNFVFQDKKYIPSCCTESQQKVSLNLGYLALLRKSFHSKFYNAIKLNLNKMLDSTINLNEFLGEFVEPDTPVNLLELWQKNLAKFLSTVSEMASSHEQREKIVTSKESFYLITRLLPFLDPSSSNLDHTLKTFVSRVNNSLDKQNNLEEGQTFLIVDIQSTFAEQGAIHLPEIIEKLKTSVDTWEEKIRLLRLKSVMALRTIIQAIKRITGRSEKLDESRIKSFMGLADNYNAFSYFFNLEQKRFLRRALDGDFDYVSNLIDASTIFNSGRSACMTIAEFLIDRVQFLFKDKTKPTFGNSWHEYRHRIGGKIESWIGNLLNYIEIQPNEAESQADAVANKKKNPRSSKKEGARLLYELKDELLRQRTKITGIESDQNFLSSIEDSHKQVLVSLITQALDQLSILLSDLDNLIKCVDALSLAILGKDSNIDTLSGLDFDGFFRATSSSFASYKLVVNQLEQKYNSLINTADEDQTTENEKSAKNKSGANPEKGKLNLVANLIDKLPHLASFVGSVKFQKFAKVQNSFKLLKKGVEILVDQLSRPDVCNSFVRIIYPENFEGNDNLERSKKLHQRLLNWLVDFSLKYVTVGLGSLSELFELYRRTCFSREGKSRDIKKLFWKSKFAPVRKNTMTDQEFLEFLKKNQHICKSFTLKDLADLIQNGFMRIEQTLSSLEFEPTLEKDHSHTVGFLSHLIKLCRIIISAVILDENIDLGPYSEFLRFSGICRPHQSSHHILRDFFSEIEGTLSIIRSLTTDERLPIQALNGEQSKLAIKNMTNLQKSKKIDFYVVLDMRNALSSNASQQQEIKFKSLEGKNTDALTESIHVRPSELSKVFQVRGSTRYLKLLYLHHDLTKYFQNESQPQAKPPYDKLIQHFAKSHNGNFSEYPFNTDLRGSIIIIEYKLRYYLNSEGKLGLVPISAQNGSSPLRWFISVPITIRCKPTFEARDFSRDHASYLGVDIGEYAFAFSLVTPTQDTNSLGNGSKYRFKILKCGLIASGAHKILADRAELLKRKQKSREFGLNDYIARLRKYLVNDYRNQIHARVVQNGAVINYEHQISGFETVGNRIKKIYDSVKKSDKFDGLEATKAEIKNTWGTSSFKFCNTVNAYLTSQTCLKCGRHFAEAFDAVRTKNDVSIKDDAVFNCKLVNNIGRMWLLEVAISGSKNHDEQQLVRLWTYDRDNQLKGYEVGSICQVSWKNLRNLISKYLRPPAKIFLRSWWAKAKSGWVVEFNRTKSIRLPKNAVKRRGNSCIFRCPFDDCGFTADADVQAATTIALRGFFDDHFKKKGQTSGDIHDFLAFLKNIEIEGIHGANSSNHPLLDKKFFIAHVEW